MGADDRGEVGGKEEGDGRDAGDDSEVETGEPFRSFSLFVWCSWGWGGLGRLHANGYAVGSWERVEEVPAVVELGFRNV